MVSAEPVFDIIRFVTALSVMGLTVRQTGRVWSEIFSTCCPRCRGTGILICPHCHGSKRLRRNPAVLIARKGDPFFVEKLASQYDCIFCGEWMVHDADLMGSATDEDDQEDAYIETMGQVRDALENKPVLENNYPPAAGTIACTMCHKSPKMIVSTFQPKRLFNLDYPWDIKISMRTGLYDVEEQKEQFTFKGPFFEFPRTQYQIAQVANKFKPEEQSFVALPEDFDFEKYTLPYIDDDDEGDHMDGKQKFAPESTLKSKQ